MEEIRIKKGPYALVFKRAIDIICSLSTLLLFWWLYVIIAILVRARLGSPVLFKQERSGKINPKTGKERIFRLYKFRTMTDARDSKGELLPDSERLTLFGSWLRKSSMDEIPELINILLGQMSIIGPRPLLVQYLPWYTEEQRRRHLVRPGLTGYAQAHGRNALDWDDKFEMDVQYVNNITFLNDIKIIFDTVKSVIKKEGITSATSSTMESFIDYSQQKGREPRS
ncbi:MAG: sugar transferase [Lachnospiraceae bacterium]|nr:sugar transferase [uncultured Acetatifactor sp.]MCI8288027.1 sugar transferase [Lachnospiraceae bacterium]